MDEQMEITASAPQGVSSNAVFPPGLIPNNNNNNNNNKDQPIPRHPAPPSASNPFRWVDDIINENRRAYIHRLTVLNSKASKLTRFTEEKSPFLKKLQLETHLAPHAESFKGDLEQLQTIAEREVRKAVLNRFTQEFEHARGLANTNGLISDLNKLFDNTNGSNVSARMKGYQIEALSALNADIRDIRNLWENDQEKFHKTYVQPNEKAKARPKSDAQPKVRTLKVKPFPFDQNIFDILPNDNHQSIPIGCETERAIEKIRSPIHSETKLSKVNNTYFLCKERPPQRLLNLLARGPKYVPHLALFYSSIEQTWKEASNQLYRRFKEKLPNQNLDLQIKSGQEEIKRRIKKYKNKSNIDCSTRINDLKHWLHSNDLTCTLTDKNAGLCVVTKQWYDTQIKKHLEDRHTYILIKDLPILDIQNDLKMILTNHGEMNRFNEWSNIPNMVLPTFKILPKLHKVPISSRPIVPAYSTITTNVSKWLATELQTIVDQYKWRIKSSSSLTQTLQNLDVQEDGLLVSFDVTSMYTNIDLDHGIFTIENLLRDYNHFTEKKRKFIIDLLKWVLKNNYFQYNNQIYRQIKGVAMGTNTAPPFADLFMIYHELMFFMCYPEMKHSTCSYSRYLDDGFFYWKNTETTSLNKIKKDMNRMFGNLQFTFEINDKKIDFLDTTIYKGPRFLHNKRLDVKSFTKEISSNNYTHPSSDYPSKYKENWITGENIRILRLSSQKEEFDKAMSTFRNFLKLSNFSTDVINKFCKYKFQDRALWLTDGLMQNNLKHRPVIIQKHLPGWHLVNEQLRNCQKSLMTLKELYSTNPLYRNTDGFQTATVAVTKGKTLINLIGSTKVRDRADSSKGSTVLAVAKKRHCYSTATYPGKRQCASRHNLGIG